MAPSLSSSDLHLLRREADQAALRLIHQLRLPAHEREDLRQDFLVDLIARLKGFDPGRGSLGAYAGVVIAHRASRLARRIRRYRSLFAPISLHEPLAQADGATLGEATAADAGYAALFAVPADPILAAERRIDLDDALATLNHADLTLCGSLLQRILTGDGKGGLGPRATIHRRLGEIRLQLLTAGLASA